MITQEQKNGWIEALLSGKYKQTYFSLKDDALKRYCVLGVLVDIYYPNAWNKDSFYGRYQEYNWLEKKLKKDTMDSLSRKNDTEHWNFKELAAWIATHIEIEN